MKHIRYILEKVDFSTSGFRTVCAQMYTTRAHHNNILKNLQI